MRTLALGFAAVCSVLVGATLEGCSSDCAIGSERCQCTAGGSCDAGLQCLSQVCVNPGRNFDGEALAAEKKAREEAEARVKALEEQSAALSKKQQELADKFVCMPDEAARAKLLAERAKLEEEQAVVKKQISSTKKSRSSSGSSTTPAVTEDRKDGDKKTKIKINQDSGSL